MTKKYDYDYISDYACSITSIHNILYYGVPFLINIIIKVIEDKIISNNDIIISHSRESAEIINRFLSLENIDCYINVHYLKNDISRHRIQSYKKLLNVLKSIDVSDCFSEDDFYRKGKVEIDYDK